MTEKTVLNEVRGTIEDVYDSSDSNNKTIKGIIIQPDDAEQGIISFLLNGNDYPQFNVGQRVVYVTYAWKRPATKDDREVYSLMNDSCPDEVTEHNYMVYDELEYDQKMQSTHTR